MTESEGRSRYNDDMDKSWKPLIGTFLYWTGIACPFWALGVIESGEQALRPPAVAIIGAAAIFVIARLFNYFGTRRAQAFDQNQIRND